VPRRQQGRPSVSDADRAEIRKRLVYWYKEYKKYRSQDAFAEAIDVARTTALGWFAKKRPKPPDLPHLLTIARREGLSLDWLLLGHGPEVRGAAASVGDAGAAIRSILLAEISSFTGGWTREEVDEFLPTPEGLVRSLTRRYSKRFRAARATKNLQAMEQLYRNYLRQGGERILPVRDKRLRRNWGMTASELFNFLDGILRTSTKKKRRRRRAVRRAGS
jgi:hypothetical protein